MLLGIKPRYDLTTESIEYKSSLITAVAFPIGFVNKLFTLLIVKLVFIGISIPRYPYSKATYSPIAVVWANFLEQKARILCD